MAYTVIFDMVSALCANKHVPKLKDNFFLSNALLKRWRPNQKEWSGSPTLVVPLGFAPEGGGGSWYAGNDKFDTTIRNPIKGANYFAKNAQVTLAIDTDEQLQCSGPGAVLNLLEQKMKIAESTMVDLVGTNLFNAGTNQKALGGLQYALPTNITSVAQTYGGITCGGSAPSADPFGFWQPFALAGPYSTGPTGSFMGTGVAAGPQGPVGTAWAACGLRSGKTPSVIVSNWGAWSDYHNSIAKNERYDRPQQQSDMAKAGFTNLMYRNASWVVDERAPRGAAATYYETVYGIDERAVSLYMHPSRNFHFEPWKKPIDQDAQIAYIYHRTELCFDERRSSFAIGQVDTSTVLAV